jgi:hypothetical protein
MQQLKQRRTNKLERSGLGNSINKLQAPKLAESKEEMWLRLEGNWKYLVKHSVQDSTTSTYTTGWNLYKQMCNELGCDPLMKQTPPKFVTSSLPYEVTIILQFIAYAASHKKLKAATINNYVSAVKHNLRINLQPVDFFEHMLIIQARKALGIQEQEHEAAADKKALAFSLDMILHYRDNIMRKDKIQDQLVLLGMKLQFLHLHRISEIIPTADDHYLRAKDVKFTIEENGKSNQIKIEDVKQYNISSVQAVTSTVRGGKNDQEGHGYNLHFKKQQVAKPEVAFCIVQDMFSWAQSAQLKGKDAFLSYKNKEILDYEYYTKQIKATATSMGLSASRYSSHSLRIAGASTLAAAGFPDHIIKKMGRWKSLAFLMYIQFGTENMQAALKKLVNTTTFTVQDTLTLHPGARLESNQHLSQFGRVV